MAVITVQIESMILHATQFGSGQPLLILHGFLGMSDNWKTLGNLFSKDYQVHLIDQRNHGRSFHADAFNYELLAQDLCNYIQHYQLENIYLVGHSMGGKVAMHLTQMYPKRVSKCVIVDMGIKSYPMHHQELIAAMKSVPLEDFKARSQVNTYLLDLIPEEGVRQFLLKNLYWIEKGKLAWRMNIPLLEREMTAILQGLPSNEVRIPTLLFAE